MHSRLRPPDLLVLLRLVEDGFTSISPLAPSLAGGKEEDVAAAAAAVWRPNSLIYCPSSLPLPVSLSPRCGGAADGGLSLFAKSTCNFRMFSRRPPSSSFFPFFVCFALAAFLPSSKRDSMAGRGRSTTPARSLATFSALFAFLCRFALQKVLP